MGKSVQEKQKDEAVEEERRAWAVERGSLLQLVRSLEDKAAEQKAARVAAEKKLAAEQKRYEEGIRFAAEFSAESSRNSKEAQRGELVSFVVGRNVERIARESLLDGLRRENELLGRANERRAQSPDQNAPMACVAELLAAVHEEAAEVYHCWLNRMNAAKQGGEG